MSKDSKNQKNISQNQYMLVVLLLGRLNKNNNKNENKKSQSSESDLDIDDLSRIFLDSNQASLEGTANEFKKFIASVGGLRIEIHTKDHKPAHFHVISKQKGFNARFDVHTLEFISTKTGKIKQKDIQRIQSFLETNLNTLKKLRSESSRMQG